MSVPSMATGAVESVDGEPKGTGESCDDAGCEALQTLQARLHSAKSDIVFLQNEHRLTLRGLHAEVAKLQKTVKELQFALVNNGIHLVDEESYKARVAALEDELDKWCCHCRYLTSQLEQANSVLVSLNQRLQLQDWQHQTELAEKDSIIANLQRELEWKCSALAELETGVRRRSLLMHLPPSGIPVAPTAAQSVPSSTPGDHTSPQYVSARGQKRAPQNKSSAATLRHSMSSGEQRLPEISQVEQSSQHQGERRASQPCLTNRTQPRSASSPRCPPSVAVSQKPTRGPNSVRFSGHLPPLADGGHLSPFPTRSLVRQQLRVHCEAGVDVDRHLSIDRIPSPELRPKKVTTTVVEVSSK